MTRKMICLSLALLGLWARNAAGEESREQHDARMKWFREAKFGIFIHWGVYAVPAGTYRGEPVQGIGEWIMLRGKIPVTEYHAFARQFNPVKYNPDAWAKIAKDAGMKYMVITAKHHDGFALFPSDVTDWDIADATPYKKDLITPLAKAAHRKGLKFGTYYSQAQDWTNPGGAKSGYKEGEGWDPAQQGSFDEYLAKIALPQAREILTRIKPDVLWWDTPTWMNAERAKPLHELLSLRPGLITNNRLGGGYRGDTETPEQFVPATGFKDRDWETCMTMNDTWGYKSYDQNWKSTKTLVRNLADVVSKGGNYLLNVGPTAEGEIPAVSVQRLKEIGAWMKVNNQAIYNTTASPFMKLTWGRCTKRLTDRGGTLFLHVFDWPADGHLVVPGLTSVGTKARLLGAKASIGVKADDNNVILSLPKQSPDTVLPVIALEFSGPLKVQQILPGPRADGGIVLDAATADIHNSLHAHARLEGEGNAVRITNWNHSESHLSWDFQANGPGVYQVSADVGGHGGGKLALIVGKESINAEVQLPETSAKRTAALGTISLPKAGVYTLELRPHQSDWKGFDLFRLSLFPKGK